MFSGPAGEKPFAVEEAFSVVAAERRALSITVGAMFAAAGFGLLLPTPSISSSSPIAAVTIPAASAQVGTVASAALRVATTSEMAPAAAPTPVLSPAKPACRQQSWPYICADGAGEARRVRIVSTDRNAPASTVASVSEATPDANTMAENAFRPDVSPSAIPSPLEAEVVPPVNNTGAPVTDAADVPVKVSVTFMPPVPAAKAKPAAHSRNRSRNLAQRHPERRRLPASREEAVWGSALAYDTAPRHRLDSYPWAQTGVR